MGGQGRGCSSGANELRAALQRMRDGAATMEDVERIFNKIDELERIVLLLWYRSDNPDKRH